MLNKKIKDLMKKRFVLFLCVFCLVSPSLFAEVEKKDEPVSTTSAIKPIVVKSDMPEFDIRLPANASTGYSWILLDDVAKRFSSIAESYKQSDSSDSKLGSGGIDTWHFKLSQSAFRYPHIIQLHFIYARPWEVTHHDISSTDQKIFTIVLLRS